MRIVPFALGLAIAIVTGAKTATIDLEAKPPAKPVLLVSLATNSAVRSEDSLAGTVVPSEGESVLGAGVLGADSTREAVADGSNVKTPNAHIPTSVVLLSCALIALATLARRRKAPKS